MTNYNTLRNFEQTFRMAIKGQKISLSIVIGYNQSDSGFGWYHFLAGMNGKNSNLGFSAIIISEQFCAKNALFI